MNICIIIEDISLKAGTERAVCNLANILSNMNNHVVIISLFSNYDIEPGFELNPNIDIKPLQFKGGKYRYYSYFKLKGVLTSEKNIDIFIGTTHAINCILAMCRIDSKKIGCEHFNYFQCPKVWRNIRKKLYPKLDAVVVLTQHDANHYKFVSKDKLFVIQNSIRDITTNEYDDDSKVIISAGRLSYQKGFDSLIRIAAQIHDKIPNWKFVIYGDGEDRDQLKLECSSLKADNYVIFKGTTNDLIDKMKHSSIYLMTSRFEGLPMVLIEAQSCGLPIISYDCPEGPSEIIHNGEDGYLIPMEDENMMAHRIIQLANDSELRKKFSEAAKKNGERFTDKKIAKKWSFLLSEVRGEK